jgi:hypothetical protein
MSISRKYGRTYHYPFSPGTTSDDRINHNYWEDVKKIETIIHTEKLDGENNCLSRYGVFARSHAAPTTSAWTSVLRQHWSLLKDDLGDLEIFGENLFAFHSIEYQKLERHYYVFAIRDNNVWLSLDEVKFYANMFDLPTVPELKLSYPTDEPTLRDEVLALVNENSVFDSFDIHTQAPCSCEGVVSRDAGEYKVDDACHHVFKYVRKGHVKTDEHWSRNWRRAKLTWDQPGNERNKIV